MNGGDDEFVLLFGEPWEELDDFEGVGAVEAGSGLVQNDDHGIGNELDSDGDSFSLPSWNGLFAAASNVGVPDFIKAKKP